MPIRNPFARRPGGNVNDENATPGSNGADAAHPGFERVETVGSRASLTLSIPDRKSQDTGEYKMSVVNDSGVYLPPSPTEKDATRRRYLSRNSTDTRSSLGDIEHFSISRESFDSYRRSFDICAKSPVIVTDQPRQSLDSSRFPRFPRSAVGERRFEREPPTAEEGFEEVGLNDDGAAKQHGQAQPTLTQQQPAAQHKKRNFFKFGSEHHDAPAASGTPPSQGMNMARFLPGRKRGQSGSGQGSELGTWPTASERPELVAGPQEQQMQA